MTVCDRLPAAPSCVFWFIAIAALQITGSLSADEAFLQDVAPIFEQKCVHCHSGSEPEGDLSLQTRSDLVDGGYIDTEAPADSVLLQILQPTDGRAEMPKDADPLSAKEIAAVRRWIERGAPWPDDVTLEASQVDDFDWWSWRPLKRPEVPSLQDPRIQTPIDQFILRALRERGLDFSEPADRRTLIRRVTFDLIGLPPTPEEVERFVADQDPRAWEKLVDRLLTSPHYGERQARRWLDVVRYADTHGYDKDKPRSNAWPYRDYVIRSFNEDRPYSRFVQEQIAGDVLFPGTPDGILGLGFLAAGPWDFIGHVEVPETKYDGMVARNLDRDEFVSGTFNTFCSVTVQCARCHNHKFDPITQEHYYGLQAIFAAVDRADRPWNIDSDTAQRREELTSRLTDLKKKDARLEDQIAERAGPELARIQKTIAALQAEMKVTQEPQFGYHTAFASRQDSEKWVEVALDDPVDIDRIVLRPCHDDFGGIGAGFGFPVRFRIEVRSDGTWHTVSDHTRTDFPNPGLRPVVVSAAGITGDRVRIVASRLADRRGVYIMALAELQVLRPDGTNAARGAAVTALDSIEAPVRWSRENLTDGRWPTAGTDEQAQQLEQALAARETLLQTDQIARLQEQQRSLRRSIQELQAELRALPPFRMVYAAATRFKKQGQFRPTLGQPRTIRVLQRGDVRRPQQAAVPGFFPLNENDAFRLPPDMPEGERRAALARWLTDPNHPLVWRSIVNRIWQSHFGTGIVATPNDFGRMGALPTHPELLDWLAVEFRDSGQSIRALHRMIVTSYVYRQTSAIREDAARTDRSNRFLWRMPRRRLEAEEIRDAMLAVSGALNRKQGGPGFHLFVLEKTEHSPHYEYHKFDPADPASHRRSIYRFIVRSQPHPWMTTLDCADSSQSTPQRSETLTSLQALSLLNNDFVLHMARLFAHRTERHADSLPEQVDRAVRLALQRSPTDAEHAAFLEYARRHGLQNLCRVLMNLSEFLYLD